MVWGFLQAVVESLLQLHERLNAKVYQMLLQPHVVPFLCSSFSNQHIFIHDQHIFCHTAKHVKQFLFSRNIWKNLLTDPTPMILSSTREPHNSFEGRNQDGDGHGLIESSTSTCSSPTVLVSKKEGTLRLCMDFRKLKPMSHINKLVERIGRAKYITTDLYKGYKFTTMLFGLHGAPETFQHRIDQILDDCEDCSSAYLDDVVIYSNTWEDHLQHLHKVLRKIQKAALTLDITKCEWAKHETKYLGFQLGNGEVSTTG